MLLKPGIYGKKIKSFIISIILLKILQFMNLNFTFTNSIMELSISSLLRDSIIINSRGTLLSLVMTQSYNVDEYFKKLLVHSLTIWKSNFKEKRRSKSEFEIA